MNDGGFDHVGVGHEEEEELFAKLLFKYFN